MFKSIHVVIVPSYLSVRIVINFYVNGYDTRGSDMELYLPTLREGANRNSFMYMGGKLWNDLPEFVQYSANIQSFEHNYKMYKRLIDWFNIFVLFGGFNVMKWLFLTFWVVRSVPWGVELFVS